MSASVREIGREFAAALAVLALVFLCFAHPALAINQTDHGAIHFGTTSLCGTPLDQNDTAGHLPCHACRTDAVALPPAPCAAEPVLFTASRVEFEQIDPNGFVFAEDRPSQPRAPPQKS